MKKALSLILAVALLVAAGIYFIVNPVITAPGNLEVRSTLFFDGKAENRVLSDYINGTWYQAMDAYPFLTFTLSVDSECDIMLDYSEGSSFSYYADGKEKSYYAPRLTLDNHETVPNGYTVLWDHTFPPQDRYHVAFTARSGEHILGYTVIRIQSESVYLSAQPYILESVSFPKIFGMYQNITEEYVENCIQEAILKP